MEKIQKELFFLSDGEYKIFQSSLMPSVKEEDILGVRVPMLRKYAKRLFKEGGYEEFLESLPHKYYEENNLHAFLIEQITDFDEAIRKTEEFLPFIDNWATCDMFMPRVFKANKEKLYEYIKKWIKSESTFAVRYAIKLLMSLYLDEDFKKEHLKLVASACSLEYYVNMAIAWYFATALFKQERRAISYIEERKLPFWVHNKAIQKAKESKRITAQMKEYLSSLKIK